MPFLMYTFSSHRCSAQAALQTELSLRLSYLTDPRYTPAQSLITFKKLLEHCTDSSGALEESGPATGLLTGGDGAARRDELPECSC